MQGGGPRQSRLLGRWLDRMRLGSRGRLDKGCLFTSSGISGSTSYSLEEDEEEEMESALPPPPPPRSPNVDDHSLPPNFDLRYGGQCLTVEQLPQFCDQLQHLVQVIRSVRAYAALTADYPAELERRLETEARRVAALWAEAANARDVVSRCKAQRRALRTHRKELQARLHALREAEVRELENSIRMSDRKLYRSWEGLKDATDPAVFQPLMDEIRSKQQALDNLVRLIENRQGNITHAPPTPLPPPPPPEPAVAAADSDEHTNSVGATGVAGRRRGAGSGAGGRAHRRRRREVRSQPLSGENSTHQTDNQSGAPLELPSRGSVRDILFFTLN